MTLYDLINSSRNLTLRPNDMEIYEWYTTSHFRVNACGQLTLGGDPVDMDMEDLGNMEVRCWDIRDGKLEIGVERYEEICFLEP